MILSTRIETETMPTDVAVISRAVSSVTSRYERNFRLRRVEQRGGLRPDECLRRHRTRCGSAQRSDINRDGALKSADVKSCVFIEY